MPTTGPHVGQLAPEIDLPDAAGVRRQLSRWRGRPVVILFYPGDETPVCTKQLCSVRDNWARYREAGAEVVGINADSVETHRRFAANHNLPLVLLSDEKREVVRAYEMSWLFGTKRGVVVVGPDGVIRYRKVVLPIFRPDEDEILNAVRQTMSGE